MTTDAEVFPKVDICVLFPNVLTRQEVTNDSLENLLQFVTVFCPVLNKSEVVFCLTADVGTVCDFLSLHFCGSISGSFAEASSGSLCCSA